MAMTTNPPEPSGSGEKCWTHVFDACSSLCALNCRCGHPNSRHDTGGRCADCGSWCAKCDPVTNDEACASGAGCTATERYHEGPCVPAGPHVYNQIDDSLDALQSWINNEGRACYAEYPQRVRDGVRELRSTIARLITEKESRPVWRCYHCAASFRARDLLAAREHFGLTDEATPKCLLDAYGLRRRIEVELYDDPAFAGVPTNAVNALLARLDAPLFAPSLPSAEKCKVQETVASTPSETQHRGEMTYTTSICGGPLPCPRHPSAKTPVTPEYMRAPYGHPAPASETTEGVAFTEDEYLGVLARLHDPEDQSNVPAYLRMRACALFDYITDLRRTSTPAVEQGEGERAWMIEFRDPVTARPMWWMGHGFAANPNRGIRFVRREDAVNAVIAVGDQFRDDALVTEHVWTPSTPAPAETREGEPFERWWERERAPYILTPTVRQHEESISRRAWNAARERVTPPSPAKLAEIAEKIGAEVQRHHERVCGGEVLYRSGLRTITLSILQRELGGGR
jgi:hypothetical protein